MAQFEEDDEDDQDVLSELEEEVNKEAARIDKSTALTAKEVAQHRVFPLLKGFVEAMRDQEDRLREEVFGSDEEDGPLDEIEERLDQIEERLAVMAIGLEVRTRLSALARSVETYCQDKPNVLKEASEATAFVAALEAQVQAVLQANAEALGTASQPTNSGVEPEPTPPPTEQMTGTVAATVHAPLPFVKRQPTAPQADKPTI